MNLENKSLFLQDWLIILCAILLVPIGYNIRNYALTPKTIQPVRVLAKNLDGLIAKCNDIELPGRFKDFGNLPPGLLEHASKINGSLWVGYVLRGQCNYYFCNGKLTEYKALYSEHYIWIGDEGSGSEYIWVFLKAGDLPDPNFFQFSADIQF